MQQMSVGGTSWSTRDTAEYGIDMASVDPHARKNWTLHSLRANQKNSGMQKKQKRQMPSSMLPLGFTNENIEVPDAVGL